jgi:hypothetical protein
VASEKLTNIFMDDSPRKEKLPFMKPEGNSH